MATNTNKATTVLMVVLLALLAACAPLPSSATTWKSCGDGSEPITVHDVKLTPDPVVGGNDASFNVAASVVSGAPIAAGSITVDIKYAGAEIAHEHVDLCDTTTCPLPAEGPIAITYTKNIPPFIPPGKYTIEFHATIGEGPGVLFCIAVDFTVAIGPFLGTKQGDRGATPNELLLGDGHFWKAEAMQAALVAEQK